MRKLIASILIATSAYAGGTKDIVEPVCVVIEVPQESYYNVALKVGTLGVGVDFSMPITDYLNARLNINGFSYSDTMTENGIDYSATATLLTAGLLLDYYPMASNAFRVSAGVYYNGNQLEGDAELASGITIKGNPYTSAQIGSLAIETKLNEVAPYIGIGWGNKGSEKGWGFSVDVGAMYHGEVGIDATLATSSLTVENDVEAERLSLENDMSDYSFYPVIMLGVTYTF